MQKSFNEGDVMHPHNILAQEFGIVSYYDDYDDEEEYDYDDDYDDEDEYDDEEEEDYSDDDDDAYLEASNRSNLESYTQEASAQKCSRCWTYEATHYASNLCARCQQSEQCQA